MTMTERGTHLVHCTIAGLVIGIVFCLSRNVTPAIWKVAVYLVVASVFGATGGVVSNWVEKR